MSNAQIRDKRQTQTYLIHTGRVKVYFRSITDISSYNYVRSLPFLQGFCLVLLDLHAYELQSSQVYISIISQYYQVILIYTSLIFSTQWPGSVQSSLCQAVHGWVPSDPGPQWGGGRGGGSSRLHQLHRRQGAGGQTPDQRSHSPVLGFFQVRLYIKKYERSKCKFSTIIGIL